MSKRLLRVCLPVCVLFAMAACGQQSPPSSSSPAAPSPAVAAQSFGELSRVGTTAGDGLSQLSRCLNGSGEAACFGGALTAAARLTIDSRAPISAVIAPRVLSAAADAPPGPPTNLSFAVYPSGTSNQISLYWRAPVSGTTPTDYRIEAGSAAGLSDLAAFNTGSVYLNFFTTVSGSGTFFVRVRAVAGGVASDPSNEVVISVSSSAVPQGPYLYYPEVVGSTVRLRWSLYWTSPAATSYVIQASSQAGGSPDLANFATGNAATSITATGVAPGLYFVRVLGANDAGVGRPSNEVSFVVLGPPSCTAAPSAPANLVALVNASTVTLGWSPSASGAPTSYVVEAGSSAGLADLATADTGSPNGTARFTGVGRGTYFVRVRGTNACGTSGPSNEIVVTVQ